MVKTILVNLKTGEVVEETISNYRQTIIDLKNIRREKGVHSLWQELIGCLTVNYGVTILTRWHKDGDQMITVVRGEYA